MEDKNHLENIRCLASRSDVCIAVADMAKQYSQGTEEKTGNTLSRANCFPQLRIKLKVRHNILMPALSEIFKRHRVVGFATSGEQFDEIHLNQSFTGIAIGNRTSVS